MAKLYWLLIVLFCSSCIPAKPSNYLECEEKGGAIVRSYGTQPYACIPVIKF